MSGKKAISTERISDSIKNNTQRKFDNNKIDGSQIKISFSDKKNDKVVIFNHCIFTDLNFFSINSCFNIEFNNCEFLYEQVKFNDLELNKIKFQHCTFKNALFNSLHLKSNLEIDNCKAEYIDFNLVNDLLIDNLNSKTQNCKLHFNSCPKTTLYYVNASELKYTSNVLEKVIISYGRINKIDFYNATIKDLRINGGNDFLEIEKIDFMDTLISGECKLNRLSLNDLILSKQRFVKDSSFKVENSQIKNKLYAFLVDLSYHSWQDIQFDKKCNLNLFNALFNGFTFASIIWPNKHLLNSNKLEHQTKEKFHWDKKEIYRQLKHLSKQNSNHLDVLAFFRNEMIEYRKYVKETKELSRKDRFLIWVDHKVSDFGQNWIRPFVLMLLTPLILYQFIALIDYSLNDFQYLGEGCENYWKGIATFINPAHKLPETFNFGMILIDFLSRALTGFFIYHFIRATRRYGKV